MVVSDGTQPIERTSAVVIVVDALGDDHGRVPVAIDDESDVVTWTLGLPESTLRSMCHDLSRRVERMAPGARVSFSRAYDVAVASQDPVRELARWFSVHLSRTRPTIVVEGLDQAGSARSAVIRLIEFLARDGAARFIVVSEYPDALPLARWMADGLATLPVPLSSWSMFDPDASDTAARADADPRDRLVTAIARDDRAELLSLLRLHGFGFIDAGDADAVELAFDTLGQRDLDPIVTTLLAICESRRDRVDTAEALFRSALDEAEDARVRATIVQRFAGEFLRRLRFDNDLLLPYLHDERIDASDRAAMLALYAEALVKAGDHEAALTAIESALALGRGDSDRLRRSRLGARAAFVYHTAGDDERGMLLAEETVVIAEAAGFDDIAASASSVLQAIAYESGGPSSALRHLYNIVNFAERSSNQWFHVYALTAALELEVERANVFAIESIERELSAYDVHYAAIEAAECLVPARALVRAWSGEFQGAYDLLAAAIDHQRHVGSHSLRLAEAALYAAAAGDRGAALEALRRFDAAGSSGTDPRGRQRALLFASLGRRLIGEAASSSIDVHGNERDRVLHEAIVMIAVPERDGDLLRAWESLEALYSVEYGGIARLIAALPDALI